MVIVPFDIIMFLGLQPMNASVVANHGLPKISGYPARLAFGCKAMKSEGHSHESNAMTKFSMIPLGFTVDLFANYKTIGVGLRLANRSSCIVSLVMTLKAIPKSIKVFLIRVPFILTSTTGFLGFVYLGTIIFPSIMSARFHKT